MSRTGNERREKTNDDDAGRGHEHYDHKAYVRYIPPEMRRRPLYRRLPGWAQSLVDASGSLFERWFSACRHAARRGPQWVGPCLALLAGTALGALIMNLRKDASDVILVVNGERITAPDLRHRTEVAHGRETLQRLVEERLVLRYAREKNLLPTEVEVSHTVKDALAQSGFRDSLLRRHLRESDVVSRTRIALAKARIVQNGMTVSDAEIAEYYRSQIDPKNPAARYWKPETVSLQVIVTHSAGEIRAAWQALKQKAEFGNTAQRYSIHSETATHEGRVPPMARGRTAFHAVPGFEQMVFSMKAGDTAPPRQFGSTWWIIHCSDHSPSSIVPLSEVREECRTSARVEKGIQKCGAQLSADFAEYEKQAAIQVFWQRYTSDVTGQPPPQVASGRPW